MEADGVIGRRKSDSGSDDEWESTKEEGWWEEKVELDLKEDVSCDVEKWNGQLHICFPCYTALLWSAVSISTAQ